MQRRGWRRCASVIIIIPMRTIMWTEKMFSKTIITGHNILYRFEIVRWTPRSRYPVNGIAYTGAEESVPAKRFVPNQNHPPTNLNPGHLLSPFQRSCATYFYRMRLRGTYQIVGLAQTNCTCTTKTVRHDIVTIHQKRAYFRLLAKCKCTVKSLHFVRRKIHVLAYVHGN